MYVSHSEKYRLWLSHFINAFVGWSKAQDSADNKSAQLPPYFEQQDLCEQEYVLT